MAYFPFVQRRKPFLFSYFLHGILFTGIPITLTNIINTTGNGKTRQKPSRMMLHARFYTHFTNK